MVERPIRHKAKLSGLLGLETTSEFNNSEKEKCCLNWFVAHFATRVHICNYVYV